MGAKDRLILVSVAFAWGFNFVVIKWSLLQIPPLLLTSLRFVVCALPVLVLPKPDIPLRHFLTIGISLGIGVFGFLYLGLSFGLNPGIASVVMQSQVFLTLLLAWPLLGETCDRRGLVKIFLGTLGLAIIGLPGLAHSTGLGFALTLLGAICWAVANIAIRKAGKVNMVHLLVWMSLIPPIPLLGLSLIIEHPPLHDLHLDAAGVAAIVYTSWISTILCYGLWGAQLRRYSVAKVAPFALLVPIFGLASAAIFLGERPNSLQLAGTALVLAALGLDMILPAVSRLAVAGHNREKRKSHGH